MRLIILLTLFLLNLLFPPSAQIAPAAAPPALPVIPAKTLSALCAHFEEKVRAGAPFDVAFAVGAVADELERVRLALAESGG